MIGQMTNDFAVLAIHMKYFTEKNRRAKDGKEKLKTSSSIFQFHWHPRMYELFADVM